jgi:hypothetical protein
MSYFDEHDWTEDHWNDAESTCMAGKESLSELCILCSHQERGECSCPIWQDFITRSPDYHQSEAIKEAQEEYQDWDESGYYDV